MGRPRGLRWREHEKNKKRSFSCVCGARFDTKGERNSHQREGCTDLRARKVELHAQSVEDTLRFLTQPGSACCDCGRLYSVDDILYGDKYMVARIYDGTVLCSDCSEADPYYEHKEEKLLYTSEIESYLQIRRSVVPFTWLNSDERSCSKSSSRNCTSPSASRSGWTADTTWESYLN